MNITISISHTPEELGVKAARTIADLLNAAIREKGKARMILSTGMSQFETLDALIKLDVDWSKVEMFHLDEYVGLPVTHKASFRKYLMERFISHINLKAYHLVDGEGDAEKNITELSRILKEEVVDVGVIGIGENGHIAFNDPPADFETDVAYKIVNLDRRCRMQQVDEGWFEKFEDVPTQAITMCPKMIMKSLHIVTAVPHKVKAEAILNTITKPVTPDVPATLMKTHPDWHLFIDDDSASTLMGF